MQANRSYEVKPKKTDAQILDSITARVLGFTGVVTLRESKTRRNFRLAMDSGGFSDFPYIEDDQRAQTLAMARSFASNNIRPRPWLVDKTK